MNKSYAININTMYIGTKEINEENIVTHAMETTGTNYTINNTSNRVIMENCRKFSSNYSHRKEITKHLTKIISKQPIMIDFIGSYIYFPLYSDRNHINHWFNIKYIENYEKKGADILVHFTNGKKIELDASYYTFERQYMCALKLFYKASQKRDQMMAEEKSQTQYFRNVEADMKFLEDYRRHEYMNFMQNIDLMRN